MFNSSCQLWRLRFILQFCPPFVFLSMAVDFCRFAVQVQFNLSVKSGWIKHWRLTPLNWRPSIKPAPETKTKLKLSWGTEWQLSVLTSLCLYSIDANAFWRLMEMSWRYEGEEARRYGRMKRPWCSQVCSSSGIRRWNVLHQPRSDCL